MTHEEMVELFACKVCGKASGLATDKCHATIGRQKVVCREHDRCRINEKSQGQLSYVKSSIDERIFLKACPGSGKTEVIGLKAAFEIKNWSRQVGGIAILTFTNNAADVIKERVCQFAGIEKAGYPHFIGTIDSWLHGYIAHPFAHVITGYRSNSGDHSIRIIDASSRSAFLNNYNTQYSLNQTGNPSANQYYMEAEKDEYVFASEDRGLDTKRNGVALADWQIADLKQAKDRFWRDGFATYQDLENICSSLLSVTTGLAENLARRFPVVVIDECQDLSWIQLQILKSIMDAGSNVHFVGDLNQAIYEFKQVSPEKVGSFAKDNDFEEMELTDNFRSCEQITDVCKKIVREDAVIKGVHWTRVESPCIFIRYSNGFISSLPAWFENFIVSLGLDVRKSAIVARGLSTVSKLRPSGSRSVNNYQRRLAMAIHLWQAGEVQAMGDALTYMGRFVTEKWFPQCSTNSRQYHCPDCVNSAISWRLFLARMLDSSVNDAKIASLDQSWSNWATSVREAVGDIARTCQPMLNTSLTEAIRPFEDLDGNSFKALRGSGSQAVLASLDSVSPEKGLIRITTIHSVKGETLDAVMLVSAPSKQGTADGYWTQWLDNPSSEAARLAYVASSRPRYLLVWAVPEDPKADCSVLEQIGLTHTELNG